MNKHFVFLAVMLCSAVVD